jgi:hypothetical protein
MSNLLLSLFLNSGLAQYPDESLYKAATLLTPEERPTVPVRVFDRSRDSLVAGRFDPRREQPQIDVARQAKAYTSAKKKPQRLAALLAHEALHVGQDQSAPVVDKELPAYERQLGILQRLGERDPTFLEGISGQIRALREEKAKATPLQTAFDR